MSDDGYTGFTVIPATLQGVWNYSGVLERAADASIQKWMASWSPRSQKIKLLSHHVSEPVAHNRALTATEPPPGVNLDVGHSQMSANRQLARG